MEEKNSPILEIIGYAWYREYYCVQVKINTHSFDIYSNQLTIIKNARLSVEFGNDYPFSFDETNLFNGKNQNDFGQLILNY